MPTANPYNHKGHLRTHLMESSGSGLLNLTGLCTGTRPYFISRHRDRLHKPGIPFRNRLKRQCYSKMLPGVDPERLIAATSRSSRWNLLVTFGFSQRSMSLTTPNFGSYRRDIMRTLKTIFGTACLLVSTASCFIPTADADPSGFTFHHVKKYKKIGPIRRVIHENPLVPKGPESSYRFHHVKKFKRIGHDDRAWWAWSEPKEPPH